MRVAPAAGLAGAALVALGLVSLVVGVIDLRADADAWGLLVVSRLPRTLAAMLAGSALAVAGLVMQMLVRNRFVEPATAGTGQGAALGLLGVTLLWPGAPIMAQMGAAFGAALLATAGFLLLARRIPPSEPLLLPLVALVYGSVVGAVGTFIGTQADLLQYIDIWLNGEFSGVMMGRYELLWISGALAVAAYLAADRLTILGLGREAAVGLGLDHGRMMALGLVIVAAVSASTVATVGSIPFVGIVVPNIASRLLGDNLRGTLPVVALGGAILVLACDILGRIVRYPYEVPVGTVFGVLGAGLFLWLLWRAPARG
jgi:iron complex transport system permease protein